MQNNKKRINNLAPKKIIIFFGNKKSCPISHKSEEFKSFCDKLAHEHGLEKLIFQKQVHGTDGIYIDSKEKVKYIEPFNLNRLFEISGDFIITNQKNIGIGVLTADCLPIIFHDTKNNVVACIHAGWRSSVNEIVTKTVQMMFETFRFAPKDLQIYFGPCAKSCCYQVQPEFLENLKNISPLAARFASQVIRKVKTDNNITQLFFDNVLFNKLLLIDLGMLSKNMHFENNHCTMCSDKSGSSSYHSYRLDGEKSLRQISFVALTK